MKKKLQVFISSTFTDLQNERQAAVEAVLKAGHIPAGMELFKAGNDTQLDTIKRWIDESDIYMLILGGRYGTIEPKSGKSYTHVEYEYALEKEIPVFAVVLGKEAMDKKVRENGASVIETQNGDKYSQFKELVLSKMSGFVNDEKDIMLAVLETITDFQHRYNFTGWISGKDVPDNQELYNKLANFTSENSKLKQKLDELSENKQNSINGIPYYDLIRILDNLKIKLPRDLFDIDKEIEISWLDILSRFSNTFAGGIHNASNVGELIQYLFYSIAPRLMMYGIVEEKKVTGKHFQQRITTKEGNKFLTFINLKIMENEITVNKIKTVK